MKLSIWPASAAIRGRYDGEIDTMEYVGKEPLLVYGTLHGPGYAGAGGLGSRYRND